MAQLTMKWGEGEGRWITVNGAHVWIRGGPAPGRGTPERSKRAGALLEYRSLSRAQAKLDAAPVRRWAPVQARDSQGAIETYQATVVRNAAADEEGEPKFYARLSGKRSGLNDSSGHATEAQAIRAAERMHASVLKDRISPAEARAELVARKGAGKVLMAVEKARASGLVPEYKPKREPEMTVNLGYVEAYRDVNNFVGGPRHTRDQVVKRLAKANRATEYGPFYQGYHRGVRKAADDYLQHLSNVKGLSNSRTQRRLYHLLDKV